MTPVNDLGQPIGHSIEWAAAHPPARDPMIGGYCRVEPLDPGTHAADLHAAFATDPTGAMWTYMGYGPFASESEYRAWAERASGQDDPVFYAVIDSGSGRAVGVASYLRIDPAVGVIEVGHIAWSPLLQRTRAATEAMYLMMRHVFDDLGYRRYEWKCDALNAPSRRAADRLGFTFEGIFRQATIYKGRNRDTAWYSIVDSEWPRISAAFERWLDPSNFDHAGRQHSELGLGPAS